MHLYDRLLAQAEAVDVDFFFGGVLRVGDDDDGHGVDGEGAEGGAEEEGAFGQVHGPDDGEGEVGIGVESGFYKFKGGFLGSLLVGHPGQQVVSEYPVLPLVQLCFVVTEHVDVVILERAQARLLFHC